MNREIAAKIYRNMVAIRVFEEKVEQMLLSGELPGFAHFYTGQEACASGVCAHLRTEDYITSTHRGHGHCIAKGGRLDRMMAELFGKKTGYNKGKGGTMHIAATELGILGANGIVAGGLPLSVGAALSSKLQKNGRVTVCFFGDGATNQGSFHESLNFAAAFCLPVVFVCENNQYGVGTRICDITKVKDLAERAAAYGMPGAIADGQDVLAVYEAAGRCIQAAREGKGPSFLELKTWRFRAHFQGEPANYRNPEEEKDWLQNRDPLKIAKPKMIEKGLLDQNRMVEIEAEVNAELVHAVKFAKESPVPELELALQDVFANSDS